MEEHQPNGFPADPRDQSPLDGFFGNQSDRPSGTTLRGIAAHHGDDALPLVFREQGGCARPRLVVKRGFQSEVGVAAADLAHRFRSQRHEVGDLGRRLATVQVRQRQGAENGTDGLNAAAENVTQFIAVGLLQTHAQPPVYPHAQV